MSTVSQLDNPTRTALDPAFLDACGRIMGNRGIILDADDREPFEVDFWRQYQGRAGAVLMPRSTGQLAELVTLAASNGVALVPQSGNTGLVRGGIPDQTGQSVVISTHALNQIRSIDPAGDFLVCEAGCILEQVHDAAKSVGRMFPLSLGSQGSCRIGGNISTNAGGVNVLRYGMMRDLVAGLEVVLADGSVWNGLRSLKKDNTGYDLKQLFIGGEGTLGIITAASLKLVPKPSESVTIWLAIDAPQAAIDLYRLFRDRLGDQISSFELLTGFGLKAAVDHLSNVRPPIGGDHNWHLLIELAWTFDDGLMAHAEAVLEAAFSVDLILDGTIAQSDAQSANMWRIREGQSEATRHIGNILRTDVSVQTNDIPALIAGVAEAVAAHSDTVTLLPFGHVGDGNLHFNFLIPPASDDPDMRAGLLDILYDRIDALDGSISAEHGIGRVKQAAMLKRKSTIELDLMARIKRSFDPGNVMNPGVILPPTQD